MALARIGIVGSGLSSRVVEGFTAVEVSESEGEEMWAVRDGERIGTGKGESRV